MAITVGQTASKASANYYYYNPSDKDANVIIMKAINDATDGKVNIEAGRYEISDAIYVYNDDIYIKGAGSDPESGTTIYATWPVCPDDMLKKGRNKDSHSGYIWVWQVNNFRFSDINFTSDCSGHDGEHHAGGPDARDCIVMTACSNVEIWNCRTTPYIYMDFINSSRGTNIKVHDNVLWIGHAAYQGVHEEVGPVHFYNNEVHIMNNAAIRVYYGTNVLHEHNYIAGWKGGDGACEIQGTMNNVSFQYNIIDNMNKCTNKWVVNCQNNPKASGDFKCSHNVWWASDRGIGYGDDGTNTHVTDPDQMDVQSWIKKGYGPQKALSDPDPEVSES